MIRSLGGPLFGRESRSYIVVTVLSVALIRLAIAFVYPQPARWDE